MNRTLIGTSWQAGLLVFCAAASLRLAFMALTANTFDPDEFVVLVLGRAVVHGAVPYRDVTFFHPPGMLYLFGAIGHIAPWWPAGRVVTLLLDSLTAVGVWRIGTRILKPSEAVLAGLIYAASPIALVSSVRILPDPILTVLGVWGIVFLVTTRSRRGAVAAGICLGLAVWTKYTAVLYLPIFLGLAGRRGLLVLAGWGGTLVCLFAPFLPEARALFYDTVVWQLTQRSQAALSARAASVGAYWLLLNPLAIPALVRWRKPTWVAAGFALGAVFLLTADAYYHYFVMFVPFAALLSAPLLLPIARRAPRLLALAALALTALWGVDMAHGNGMPRMYVSSSKLSQSVRVAYVLDHGTAGGGPVLTDQFQYALLAGRPLATDYFWNMAGLMSADSLEDRVPHVAAVVRTRGGHPYPKGFIDYLQDEHYRREQTPRAIIWLTATRHDLDAGRAS